MDVLGKLVDELDMWDHSNMLQRKSSCNWSTCEFSAKSPVTKGADCSISSPRVCDSMGALGLLMECNPWPLLIHPSLSSQTGA